MAHEPILTDPALGEPARQGSCLEIFLFGVLSVLLLWRIGVWLDPYDALAGAFWPGLGMLVFAIVALALVVAIAPRAWRRHLVGRGAGALVLIAALAFIATGFGARSRAIRSELVALGPLVDQLAGFRAAHGRLPDQLAELDGDFEARWIASHQPPERLAYERQGETWQLLLTLHTRPGAPPEFEYTGESFGLRSDGERPSGLELAQPFEGWWRGFLR